MIGSLVEHILVKLLQAFKLDVQRAYFRTLTAEPEDKEEGMVVFADGTSWNPGGGKGLYLYKATAWIKIA